MTGVFRASSFLALIFLCVSAQVVAQPKVVLAATERHPYIGQTLPERGYVHQLVTEAFKKSGWDVDIRFYPQARALAMARNGGVDGLLPVYASSELEKQFRLSAPFPGDRVGLMKRKDRDLGLETGTGLSSAELLEKLAAFRFGVVRGAITGTLFDQADTLTKELISSDVLNLEKLFRRRIDLAVIDKFTAADLMVNRFPHMIGHLEFIPSVLAEADFHIAFSNQSARLDSISRAFDDGLKKLAEEGRLQSILADHGLASSDQTAATGKTKVIIGAVANPHLINLQRVSGQFERQNPDIELEWRVLDEPILRLRTQSDLAIADGRFDVMAIGPYEAKNWARRGWLTPLSLPESYRIDDLVPSVRKALSYSGRLYALPLYAESSMTYYRKDLFEAAGIQMPGAPTYAEIRQFAAKIHDPERGVYGICLRGTAGWGANMALITTMINTFDGRWFDQQWNPKLDTQAWQDALNLYRDLLQNYGPPEPHLLDYNRVLTLFSEGHCGIWVDATSFAESLSNPSSSIVGKNLGWANAPIAKTPTGSRWLWVWGLAIPAFANEKDAAMRFITWATSKEYIDTVARSEGWLAVPPGTRHSTYSAAYRDKVPFGDAVYKAITSVDPENPTHKQVPYQGIQYVDIPEFSSLGTRVGRKVEQVLNGQLSVEQALEQSQELVRKQMEASGYLRSTKH